MNGGRTFDVAVIGAGVFGAWTAWHLAKRGQRVALIDAYGPAHSRASSGGETRIIRMGYGGDELYTRWSQRSLEQWKKFFEAARQALFLETGVLWMAGEKDARLRQTSATLKWCGVSLRAGPQTNGIWPCERSGNKRWRAHCRGAIRVCVRSVAWKSLPGRPWRANLCFTAGSVLLWCSGRRYAVCTSGAADLAVSGRPGLWNAGHRGAGIEDCVRRTWRASRS